MHTRIAMLNRLFFCVVIAAVIGSSPANAQLAEWWRTCTGKSDVNFDQQIKSCTSIIQSPQETPLKKAIAHRNRGNAYSEMRDYNSAMADYDEAIKLDVKFADAYFQRGLTWYYGFGNTTRAITDYSEAIRLDPQHANAYFYRAFAWRLRGDIDRAIADMTEVIRIEPNNAEAYLFRGGDWYDTGDFDRAIADYTDAVRVDPNYGEAYGARAKAFIAKGEPGRAVADYTEAMRVEPNAPDHPADRGFAHFYQNDLRSAAADFHRAIEMNVEGIKAIDVALFRHLARTHAGVDATAELAAHYGTYKGAHPVFELYLGRGTVEAVLNDWGPSRRCEADFYVGQWHLMRGNRAEARTFLRNAAERRCNREPRVYYGAVFELKRLEP